MRPPQNLFDGLRVNVAVFGFTVASLPLRWMGTATVESGPRLDVVRVRVQPSLLGLLFGLRGGSWRGSL